MKILLIFTGGTIGSSVNDIGIRPDTSTQSQLISYYQNNSPMIDVEFDTLSPLNILSENIQPSDWTTIIETIQDQDLSSYDGIILTHGTDTLSYTANALALALPELAIPLILVSAHRPPNDPLTNAHNNFKAAIACIKERLMGVFVSYQNPDESFVSIFHAFKLTQSLQLSSRFQALHSLDASFQGETLNLIDKNNKRSTQTIKKIKPLFSEDILYIKPYPGLDYNHYNFEDKSVILHDLYHSGTCDINRIKPFIRQCKRHNILLLMAPIKSSENYYETTQELIDMGVHFLFDISIEHALVKLMLAHKNFSTHEELLEYIL